MPDSNLDVPMVEQGFAVKTRIAPIIPDTIEARTRRLFTRICRPSCRSIWRSRCPGL